VIRRATANDARAIAEVQKRAWFRAYADIVDPALLAEETVDEREARWMEHLSSPSVTLVAEVAGRVCGFATVGASGREGAVSEEGELMALYVDPPAQGAGLGRALLAAAEDALRADGYAGAVACVMEANDAARVFYEKHGWHHDGQPAHPDRWAPCVHHRKRL